jgi:hypothetical protein
MLFISRGMASGNDPENCPSGWKSSLISFEVLQWRRVACEWIAVTVSENFAVGAFEE